MAEPRGTAEPKVGPARPLHMRRSFPWLLAVMLGLAVVPFPQQTASASCAAPYLDLGSPKPVFQRRATVTVEGRAFVDGCRDTMSCEVGCSSCEYDDPPPVPLKDVGLTLVQGGRTWELDVADAGTAENDRLGWVTWTFEIPAGAKPGPARLDPDHGEPARIRLR